MDIGQYIGRPMISWLWYNPNYEERFGNTNIVCYIYPRLLANASLETINAEEDFPENGRIEVFIQGGQSAREVFEQFGPLISVRLNKEVPPSYKGYNRYRVNYQPQMSNYGHTSDVTIERLSSKKFYQVIETESSFDALQNSRALDGVRQPFLDYVLVKTGDSLYGPFEYEYEKNQLSLKSTKILQYRIGEYSWSDCVAKVALITDQEKNAVLSIFPGSDLPESQKSYDWISDEQLVLELISALKASSQYTRSQLRKIAETGDALIKYNRDEPLTDERRQRLQSLVQNLAAWSELADSVVKTALEDDSMCEILADVAVNAHLEEIKESLIKHEGIREHILDLRREEHELKQKIENLQQSETDLQSRVSVMKDAWENDPIILERKIALEEYERKIHEARIRYDYERIQQERLDESLKTLLQQYRDKAGQISRLFDMKIMNGLLHGTDTADFDAPSDKEFPHFNPSLLHAPMSREEIVDRVSGYFRDSAGRKVNRNDIINYLICISQGFITTFVGKPGIGKTTLCNILAKSLGLVTRDAQSRYIEIPVERDWTSCRDFIGAYNPITKMIDVHNADIVDTFMRLDQECNFSCNISNIAPFFILLDEANSSPIDCYWSAFLQNCDTQSSMSRLISVGGGKTWKIPRYLRFLATVNLDIAALEKLPSRFLERSWTIMLDFPEILEDAEDNSENYKDMVPFSSLYTAFCPSMPTEEVDKMVLNKWNIIRAIFQKHHLPIMPRNLKMVRDYCSIACQCMDRDTPESQLAPLDYSLAQKILPIINGSGENYRELIYDLRRECIEAGLHLSIKHLERMQRKADNNQGFYCFF